MRFLVFGFEVEDINGETDFGKIGIQLDVLSKRAIVVIEYVVGLEGLDTKDTLNKFLEDSIKVTRERQTIDE